MNDTLAVKAHWLATIDDLLRKHVPQCEVWAYGSRVSGQNHDASDLDLVVRAPSLKPVGPPLNSLREALRDSNVPILVQVHDWARLPESFHREIEQRHVVIHKG